jgi:hypothetical protein
MTHELVDDDYIDDTVPASIAVPRGLPPCRAALSRFMAYRQSIAADIAKLESGHDRLLLDLARADSIRTQAEEAFEQEASSLADRVMSGAETLIAAFTGRPKPAPGIDVRLTKAALTKIEGELQAKHGLADRLQDRYGEFVNAALREHGQALGAEYLALLDQLRGCVAKLHSLDVATGGPGKRDVRAMVPGFSAAGQPSRQLQIGPGDDAVNAGVMSWRALGKAWASDPKASPRAHLKFRLRDPAVRFTPP